MSTIVRGREPSSVSYNQAVTNGSQLRYAYDVGAWALQAVPKGTEVLQSMTGPPRGYFRFDAAIEFTSDVPWPSNANDSNPSVLNDPNLHEGIVTGSPVVIDGFTVPVGTYLCQFRDFPDGYDFYCQGTSLPIMFRGCRFRMTDGLGASGLFNDYTSTSAQHIYVHYCDIGLNSYDLSATASGLMRIGFLGGSNHRIHRCYWTKSGTMLQPNTQGVVVTENWIAEPIYAYGAKGTSGGLDYNDTAYHLNGCSCEGGISQFIFARNRVDMNSPDGATGSNGFTAPAQTGYSTQPGQTGYGAGTNPGRVVAQTDCLALFNSNFLPNQGAAPDDILIADNWFAGGSYCVYAGQHDPSYPAFYITMRGNRFSTKYWTDGGSTGPVAAQPVWGTNGNTQSDNLWDDDYGTGGDGVTALADRQYPAGNGPRAGTSVI